MVVSSGKLCLQWVKMWGEWLWHRYGTTLWEDGEFGRLVFFGSVGTYEEEEVQCLLGATPLVVCAEAVEMEGSKEKFPRVF